MSRAVRTLVPMLLAAVAWAGQSDAQRGGAFTVVQTGRGFDRLDAALASLNGGDGTIRIAPGRYHDCAVQEGGRVSFVAAQAGTAIFDGGTCEDKATLVLHGRAATVDGLVFTHLVVPDGNGAGIRIETGDLKVVDAMFVDSQCGILSAADPASAIVVDHSTFSGLGKDPTGNGAHSIYVGEYGSLTVTHSRFERGTGGHYVKSRAPRIAVLDSSFDDTRGHDTNYMIDLSNGATGRITGNVFVQGKDKENYSTMIAVAAEGAKNASAGLTVTGNQASLAPGVEHATTFVREWTDAPIAVSGNRLGPRITAFAHQGASAKLLHQAHVAVVAIVDRMKALVS